MLEPILLCFSSVTDPVPVTKHKNVRSDWLATLAFRDRFGLKSLSTNVDLVNIAFINFPVALALEMHDASVTLRNFIAIKTCFAKVVVHVAREDKVVPIHVLFAKL